MTTLPAVAHPSILPRSVPVAFAIGRVEARRLLRHPATLLGIVLSFAITIAMTWRYVPVLNRYDALTHEALIPLAAAVLIAAHLATIRSRRHGTTELFDSLAASDAIVTAGHLISVLYVSCFALILVIAQLVYMRLIGGVTSPRPVVIFIGPALVAFTGALGVALGRWAPRLFVGPLGIAGLVAFCTALTTNTYAHEREWLSLWVPSEAFSGVASEVTLRPYGWRLVYFLGLVVVAAAVAFARHPSKRVVAIGLSLAALLGTAYAGSREMHKTTRGEQMAITTRLLEDYKDPLCREYASVSYCPSPGYEAWIERWRKPTEGVLAAAPAEARPDDLRFLQAAGAFEAYDEDRNPHVSRWFWREGKRGILSLETDIHPSLRWGRNGAEGESELAIALLVAARTIGVDTRFRLTQQDLHGIPRPRRHGFRARRLYDLCTTLEQGRSVVGLWLAAQATDGTEAAFSAAAARAPYVADPSDGSASYFEPLEWSLGGYLYDSVGSPAFVWGARETNYASQLLEQDESEVRATIAENWDRLTDPATTSDQAAAILRLTPLPSLEEAIDNWDYLGHYWGVEQLSGVPQCH